MSAENGPKLVEGRSGYAEAALELAGQVRNEVLVFSRELDHRIYGDEAFVERLKQFLLSHQRARLRGLVHSPQSAVRYSNRLIELAKRLSSRIEFRQLPDEHLELCDEYLICDARHYLHRRNPRDLHARYELDAPLSTRPLLQGFEDIWQQAAPAREFTDLKI